MRHWRHACQVGVSSLPLGVDRELGALDVCHALRVAILTTTDVRTEWQVTASRAAALLCRFVNASCCTAIALGDRVVRWDVMGSQLDASRMAELHVMLGRLGLLSVDIREDGETIALQVSAGDRPSA